ncbi:MAG: hypothetical protein MUD11_04480 [Rhodobacteraceae bacterium]|jgi:hypothetical protein|nr:hypothetical protein [Paracoccaceae bacterium]
MTRSRKLSVAAALSLALLAACGGGVAGGNAAAAFGQSFAQAFLANDRTDPVEPGGITFQRVADNDEETRLTLEPVNF